jgi:hypothetical protein
MPRTLTFIVLFAFILTSCGQAKPVAPTATLLPTITPTSTEMPTPTETPTPAPTNTPQVEFNPADTSTYSAEMKDYVDNKKFMGGNVEADKKFQQEYFANTANFLLDHGAKIVVRTPTGPVTLSRGNIDKVDFTNHYTALDVVIKYTEFGAQFPDSYTPMPYMPGFVITSYTPENNILIIIKDELPYGFHANNPVSLTETLQYTGKDNLKDAFKALQAYDKNDYSFTVILNNQEVTVPRQALNETASFVVLGYMEDPSNTNQVLMIGGALDADKNWVDQIFTINLKQTTTKSGDLSYSSLGGVQIIDGEYVIPATGTADIGPSRKEFNGLDDLLPLLLRSVNITPMVLVETQNDQTKIVCEEFIGRAGKFSEWVRSIYPGKLAPEFSNVPVANP